MTLIYIVTYFQSVTAIQLEPKKYLVTH